MSQDSEEIKIRIQEQSKKLTELGSILAKNQFTYKIEEKISKEYWQKRIQDLTKYNEDIFSILFPSTENDEFDQYRRGTNVFVTNK